MKGEQRLTLRLMEDVELPHGGRQTVPAPPWSARPSSWDYSGNSYGKYQRISDAQTEPARTFDANATIIVLKDRSSILGQSCQAQGNHIVCLGEGGRVESVPMARVDVAETVRSNRERGVPFSLGMAAVE